ncbi:hypothetical protein K438DRAFT_1987043 [Mycena galopus ATCC 62051]|nr:hypothetical protein K438DRAFT_1987043 [Mycena galopus ATCC 62051]
MTLHESPPAFPPELEREVFEICAVSRPVTIPKLMLVARRVKEWVEPLLYRIICLGPRLPPASGFPGFFMEIIMLAMRRKPSSFFETAVRHLMIDYYQDRDEVDKILDVCTGVQHLSIDVAEAPDSWLDRIVSFPLERLQIHSHKSLIRVLAPEHTLCRRLTHLEITGFIPDGAHAVCDALIALPHLSHLAFSNSQFVHSCPQLLESCKHLRALVFRTLFTEEIQTHHAVLERNVRFVQFSWEFLRANEGTVDWHIGAQGGVDSWTKIEHFIAKRRSREIDPLQYLICQSADDSAS